MYVSKMHIENYRLLKDVTIDFDRSLTLFVGKNNSGKTSIMNIMELLLSDANTLPFDDYPLDCRHTLYKAVKDYWNSKSLNPISDFRQCAPITSVALAIDYSEEDSYGELSNFIIDLNESVNIAIIKVSFDVSLNANEVLDQCKLDFDVLKATHDNPDESLCLAKVVQDAFSKLFEMNITAVNPSAEEDFDLRTKRDLQKLFLFKTIKAERGLDESDSAAQNPIGHIMNKLFSADREDVDESLRPALEQLQLIIQDVNFNVQNRVNKHMNSIITSMASFGYPDGEDLTLKANTRIAIDKSIIDSTQLAYVSQEGEEFLPESHNGLGYKNLIRISLELHGFARNVRADRTKIPILFIEEPEAHMHPQLQSTFIGFLEEFLKNEIGKQVVQTIITTHSPHVANTVSFANVRYIRRFRTHVEYKNLMKFPATGANEEEKKQHIDFLQKYMKLSYCDLYFCDKAILVEGASERLLLPDMIRKCEGEGLFGSRSLLSQYYTIIEIGGAYAHLFYDFVDYLGIPTLIITDIDFVDNRGQACQKGEAKRSSNAAINKWCHDKYQIAISNTIPIDKVLKLQTNEEKLINGIRRIAFQEEEENFHPRSLEEAIINVNRALFGKSADDLPIFSDENEKKTGFAIKLLYEPQYESYTVPSYIKNGLIWLCKVSRYPEGEEPLLMHKRKR